MPSVVSCTVTVPTAFASVLGAPLVAAVIANVVPASPLRVSP